MITAENSKFQLIDQGNRKTLEAKDGVEVQTGCVGQSVTVRDFVSSNRFTALGSADERLELLRSDSRVHNISKSLNHYVQQIRGGAKLKGPKLTEAEIGKIHRILHLAIKKLPPLKVHYFPRVFEVPELQFPQNQIPCGQPVENRCEMPKPRLSYDIFLGVIPIKGNQ